MFPADATIWEIILGVGILALLYLGLPAVGIYIGYRLIKKYRRKSRPKN